MALTKTLQFDDDVLAVIRAMQWEAGGTLGVITETLDRDLYVKVNKALEAMGGKWDRKVGRHVFERDPRDQVEGLLENGSLTVARDGFFETPPEIVDMMIAKAGKLHGTILEPSAGKGAIVRGILDPANRDGYINLYLLELNVERAEYLKKTFPSNATDYLIFVIQGCDFLEFDLPAMYDAILMNPPFEEGQDIAHIQKAYSLLKTGGVLVAIMGEGAFFRSDKKASGFRVWLEKAGGENTPLPPGSFKESGTGVQARLVKIVK